MQNIDTRVRCHPFSNAPFVGCKHCCHEMTLVSALVHIFKCHTCLHRRDTPDGVTPIFPADKCADEHLQIITLLHVSICTTAIFHGTWSKTKLKHILLNVLCKQLTMHLNHMFVPIVWTPCG